MLRGQYSVLDSFLLECRVLQAVVDRMVPVFMQQLLVDYYNWVEEKPQDLPVSAAIISPAIQNSDHKSTEAMPL